MYHELPNTKLIGIGDFGRNAIEVIEKSWSKRHKEDLDPEMAENRFAYVNITSKMTDEKIASIFESANSTIVLADVSADLELTEKVAKTAKAEGLFTVIGLVNGNEEQASVLADISGSAIILPSVDDACVYRFASTVISPMHVLGPIGIDWTDVKNNLQDSGLGYFSYGNGNDIESIVGDCRANFSEVCKLDIMKNVLINIETTNDLDMYFIDGVVGRTCENLHDDASLCFSAQILDDSHKVSVMGIIVATGK